MKSGGLAVGAIILLTVIVFASPVLAGDLNPPGSPAPTMKTLDQIPPTWSMKIPCDTQQNCPRFVVLTDFSSLAVLDKETGLVWEQTPGANVYTWQDTQDYCFGNFTGGRGGWGLPTMEELSSLLKNLPAGHPFANVQAADYWSATTLTGDGTQAWCRSLANRAWHAKTETHLIWCVRGGRGYDGR